MRGILLKAMMNLEFITGLKQIRDYTDQQVKDLLDTLEECALEYVWLDKGMLDYILKRGMRGSYGDFYHLNVMTLSKWIKAYYRDNEQKINMSILKKDDEKEVSEEEKQYWLEIGNQNFRDKFEQSKTGHISPLSEWGPYFYDRFIEKGLLKEGEYNFDEDVEKKMLRFEKGFGFSDSMLASRKKEVVWRQFISDMIAKEVDLTGYL